MQTSDFHYVLPEELIAQHPVEERDQSRLLVLDADGKYTDSSFKQLPDYLSPGDLLVLNDTRVIPARLFASKETGGKVEIMLERILDDHHLLVQLRVSKSPKTDAVLLIDNKPVFKIKERQGDMYVLTYLDNLSISSFLDLHGHMPLPPYIDREDQPADRERYQTVYSSKPGAVAAPTAGLHFTEDLFRQLRQKSIESIALTLHVGAGTFQPVRVKDIKQHQMHSEYLTVSKDVVARINSTKAAGGRVIAVGPTVVRALETAAREGQLKPYRGDTNIFIYPGFTFNAVDMLITNFHLPESTLLMLVCAFAGKQKVMRAYHHAIEQQYRFFSYGDAMLITRNTN